MLLAGHYRTCSTCENVNGRRRRCAGAVALLGLLRLTQIEREATDYAA